MFSVICSKVNTDGREKTLAEKTQFDHVREYDVITTNENRWQKNDFSGIVVGHSVAFKMGGMDRVTERERER